MLPAVSQVQVHVPALAEQLSYGGWCLSAKKSARPSSFCLSLPSEQSLNESDLSAALSQLMRLWLLWAGQQLFFILASADSTIWQPQSAPVISLVDEGWYQLTAVLNFGIFKRIQTPHSWFWDFRADKTSTTRWSGGRVQIWVQVWAPACYLAITPDSYSRTQSKILTAKWIAKLLGPRSGTAWAA